MKDIVAITVSTNYSDLLELILPQNFSFFIKWYIITDKNDIKTLEVINKYNYDNIEVLFYDFRLNNSIFNKGGAIKFCQEMINKIDYKGNILILDSDIYLPNHFNEIIDNMDINDKTLYGPANRYDYHSYDHFVNDTVDNYYERSRMFDGYFQLYKYDPSFLYQESNDCSICDEDFHRYFTNFIIIEKLEVKHLGKNNHNWKGRQLDDFHF